ncbi:hypothetical protein TIFTF001_042489 [Ficus carica]|uniref:Uncharacterized protein n=1 Tax=Ficus carica TaxID=3494 RepID=A0AA87ZNG5_FICCA|nr:hypothetical protein TIFTF001_042489 [Ficus carica]
MVQILVTGAKEVGVSDVESGESCIGVKRMLSMQNLVKEDSGLHVGMRNGPLEVVKLLIDANRELLGLVNGVKESPIFPTVEGGSFHIAKHIIEKFLDSLPPCGGDNAMNALRAAVVQTHHRAPYSDHDQMPRFSLENLRRMIRIFALHLGECIRNSRKPKTEKRVDLIQEKDVCRWTPFLCAGHLGHLKATRLLLKHYSYASFLKDKLGMSALYMATKEGHVRVMQEILCQTPEAGDVVDNKGWTALHIAAVNENIDVVKYVLRTPKLEVILNVANKDGNTPFAFCGRA